MPFGAIAAFLAVMIVIFIVGNAWFHIVEGILGGIKRLILGKDDTPWHPLPADREDDVGKEE